MGQPGMPMLFRLGTSMSALSPDFVKYDYTPVYTFMTEITNYITTLIEYGFNYSYV